MIKKKFENKLTLGELEELCLKILRNAGFKVEKQYAY